MNDETDAPKGEAQRKKTASKKRVARKQATKPAVAKGSPWTFPKNTLEDAIKIAKAIEEKNAGNPMPANSLAIAVGFRLSSDWRFLEI